MINVLLSCKNPLDATSFYRGAGPISELRKKIGDIQVVTIPNLNWASLKAVDVMFMQRPESVEDVKNLEMGKKNGKKIWVDYDDDLLGIPMWNAASLHYNQPQIRANIKILLQYSDVVTVSTEALKEKFSEFNKNIFVVPNAMDDSMLTISEHHADSNVVTWRGSATHEKDLIEFTPAMGLVANALPDHKFVFMGEPSWQVLLALKKYSDNIHMVKNKDVVYFYQEFRAFKPKVHIVPMSCDSFNSCKSNIAWIEATVAGAVCLAPNMPEWKRPGIVNYNSPEDFSNKLLLLLEGGMNTAERHAESKAYIEANLKLDTVNEHRKNILEGLVSKWHPRLLND